MSDKHNSIYLAWNEAEEIHCDLESLTDEELLECREVIKERAKRIMELLHNLT